MTVIEEQDSHRTCVAFRWVCEQVGRKEKVHVVGDCEELGNWNPANGVQLEHIGESPLGSTRGLWADREGIALPLRRPVQYKYVIYNAESGDSRWEEIEGNRSIIPTGRNLIVEDDEGLCRQLLGTEKRQKTQAQPPALRTRTADTDTSPKSRGAALGVKRPEMSSLTKDDTVLLVFKSLPLGIEKDSASEDGWRTVKVDPFNNVTATSAPLINVALMKESLQVGENQSYKVKIVGQPNVSVKDPQEQQKIAKVYAAKNCIPVFVDSELNEAHLQFCHSYLWPIIHNVKSSADKEKADADAPSFFDEAKWKEYQKFNRSFADVVEAHCTQGTLIWIHNYYLLMLPRLLLLRRPDATMGFFMHCPFPNSEVFRCMPNREDILQSLLSCKVVGFQIFEYARHFLNCSSALFKATHSFQDGGILQVEHESRSTVIRADHVVIPYESMLQRLQREEVKKRAAALRKEYEGTTVIGSIDNAGSFAGLLHKLRAFRRFVMDCAGYRSSVSLHQHVVVRDHDAPEQHKALLKELNSIANDINSNFSRPGKPPLVKIVTGVLTVDEQLATLQAFNILLDTSTKDGLNLLPFMFYCAHTEDREAVVVVSEFSGCSSVLPGALHVNPWHTQAVVDALVTALSMDPKTRDANFQRDHSYVASQTLGKWLNQNLAELKREGREKVGPVRGLGADFRMLIMERGFVRLPVEKVVAAYRRAKNRAIFLDNEGTLMLTTALTDLRGVADRPSKELLQCLQTLATSKGNNVVVLSGRSKEVVDSWFGGVEGLGLCAELGFYWVPPGKLRGGGSELRWQCITQSGNEDNNWKSIVSELLKQYTQRVQGSVIENKGSAITWIYRNVGEPQVVKQVALELARFLDPSNQGGLLYGFPVKVVSGRGYVEVRRHDVDKGIAVGRCVAEIQRQLGEGEQVDINRQLGDQGIDFMLCIGNDRSDEDMFETVNRIEESRRAATPAMSKRSTSRRSFGKVPIDEASPTFEKSKNCEDIDIINKEEASGYWTVTVGRKPSSSKYYIRDVAEVNELLGQLSLEESISKVRGHCSMPNFNRFAEVSDEMDN